MMTAHTPTPALAAELRRAEAHLRATSPAMSGLIDHVGLCAFAPDPDVFAVLLRSVASQLISVAAARAITGRLEAAAGHDVTPARVAALAPEVLKTCGVSGAKQRTVLGLANHFLATPDLPARLAAADDAGVRSLLLPLYGVGPWTVDMVLLFALGRLDTLPVGDLGLRAGAKALFGLAELPAGAGLVTLAEPWRPYRAVATWYLWRGNGWAPPVAG